MLKTYLDFDIAFAGEKIRLIRFVYNNSKIGSLVEC